MDPLTVQPQGHGLCREHDRNAVARAGAGEDGANAKPVAGSARDRAAGGGRRILATGEAAVGLVAGPALEVVQFQIQGLA